jgi:hypothetical protein
MHRHVVKLAFKFLLSPQTIQELDRRRPYPCLRSQPHQHHGQRARTPENRWGGMLARPNKLGPVFAQGLSASERIWTPLTPMSVGVRTNLGPRRSFRAPVPRGLEKKLDFGIPSEQISANLEEVCPNPNFFSRIAHFASELLARPAQQTSPPIFGGPNEPSTSGTRPGSRGHITTNESVGGYANPCLTPNHHLAPECPIRPGSLSRPL